MLTQKKLQVEWNYAIENRRRQSEKGKAGFEARKRNQIQRNQILGASRGLSTGISRGSTGIDASISNKKKDRIDQNYTGLSTGEEAAREEGDDGLGDGRRDLGLLLKTPLMRRVR